MTEKPDIVKQFWNNIAKSINIQEPKTYHENYQCQNIKSNWWFYGCLENKESPDKKEICDTLAHDYSSCVLKHELYKVIRDSSA